MEQDLELIHSYIRGTLEKEEYDSISERIQEDTEFANMVDQERMLLSSIVHAEREKMKEEFSQLSTRKNRPGFYLRIAAALIPFMIVGLYFILTTSNTNQLYDTYYEKYGVYEFGSERGENEVNEQEKQAFQAYRNGAYEEAIPLLQSLIASDKNPGYQFYLGLCYQELEQYKRAIEVLSEVDRNSKYHDLSEWYEALAYLKIGDKKIPKLMLEGLAEKDSALGRKAKQLVEEL